MSKRYTGGIVSATKPTTTSGESGTASGMWEIEQQGRLQAAGLWPIPYIPKYVEDVFSTYLYTGNSSQQPIKNNIQLGGIPTNGTVLHLTGDTLTDSAPVPCALVNTGSVVVNTTTKKYGTGSLYIPSTGADLSAYSPDLQFGTSDFTVECWVYATSTGNQGIFQLGSDVWGNGSVFVSMYPANVFQWGWDGSYGGSGTFSTNTWIHVALVRQGNTLKFYVNGTQSGSTNTYVGNINVGACKVGYYYTPGQSLSGGYIDDFRVSNKAVYTANFTPPASPLPIDTLVAGSNYGGMVWIKSRPGTTDPHVITDTVRGATKYLASNNTNAQVTNAQTLTAFNASGFSIGTNGSVNQGPTTEYVAWTFRKQPKFFDIVTYTGNGVDRNISHNLGSAPGCVIIKQTNSAGTWRVWHRSGNQAYNFGINLNSTAAYQDQGTNLWGSSGNANMTSTTFSVGGATGGQGQTDTNSNGNSFVAYLFAHDAGGFGASGADSVISCGSYTGTGAGTPPSITLGWEPQWIIIKAASNGSAGSQNWNMFDNMRGLPVGGQEPLLLANTSGAEVTNTDYISVNGSGFQVVQGNGNATNENGTTYIYIAIRRGPMRTPTSGASVYYGLSRSGTSTNTTVTGSPFPVDLAIIKNRFNNDGNASNSIVFDRLRGPLNAIFATAADAASSAYTGSLTGFDVQNGYRVGNETGALVNYAGSSGGTLYMNWMFRRAPGFLDIVQYTGTGAVRTVAHGLGAVPELIITKPLSTTGNWATYAAPVGAGSWLRLNGTNTPTSNTAVWNGTNPTATVFSLGTDATANFNGTTFIAYLFASLPGVSKVGSYTGTAASLNIDCGFTGGARFVLIKRTDAPGSWYVFDTTRGIVAGNEVYMMLNEYNRDTSADWIAPLSSGFQLTANGSATVNVNGGTYIYLAIA